MLSSTFSLIILYLFLNINLCEIFAEFTKEDILFQYHSRDIPGVKNLNWKWKPNESAKKRPTRIFVHGYKAKMRLLELYVQAYLNADDFNFINVNWIKGAHDNYLRVKRRIPTVALQLALFLEFMDSLGILIDNMIIIGHSLGAHVVGISGKLLPFPKKIPIIIGLDPAQVLFKYAIPSTRLYMYDALRVIVIHTSGGHFAFLQPMGTADFYPNYGKNQPGCPRVKKRSLRNLGNQCSHSRVHRLHWESLSNKNAFTSIRCTSFEELQRGICTKVGETKMRGEYNHWTEAPSGIYYLETMDSDPYSKPAAFYHNIRIVEKNKRNSAVRA